MTISESLTWTRGVPRLNKAWAYPVIHQTNDMFSVIIFVYLMINIYF